MEAGEKSYQQTVVGLILSGSGWHGNGMAGAIGHRSFVPNYKHLKILEMGEPWLLGQIGKAKLEKNRY